MGKGENYVFALSPACLKITNGFSYFCYNYQASRQYYDPQYFSFHIWYGA